MTNIFPLNLSEINKLSLPPKPVLTTDECNKTFAVFDQNMASTIGLSLVPGISAMLSLHMMHAMDLAHQQFDMVPDMSQNEEERNSALWNLASLHLQDIARKEEGNWHDGVSGYTASLDRISPMFKAQSHEFLHGLLKAIVVQSWTALETLSKDLWELINASPNASFLRPTERQRRGERLWFTSRSGIRRCYAFSFKCPKIDAAIHQDEIDAIAVLRNVIVHSAGRVDGDFQKEVGDFHQFSAVTSLAKTNLIPVDGKLVRSVIEPAIRAAYNLSARVDDWIKLNP